MKTRTLGFGLIFVSVLLTGCATNRGVEEFGIYREAFQQARSASDSILDRVAVAERQLWQYCSNFAELTKKESPNFATDCEKFDVIRTEFRVADTSYLVTAGDPPQTAAFRRAITVVGAYTEALNGLASGQTAEAVAGQIGQITGLAAAAAAAVSPAGAAGSLAAAIAGINTDVAALKSPITTAFGFAARAELRAQLTTHGDTMKSALAGVMNATPAMFKVLVAAEYVATPAGENPDPDRVKVNRLLLANWVELMKASARALDAAVAAAGSEDGVAVGEALASAQSLATLAHDVRRTLAGDTK